MIFERFEVPGLAHYSYAVGCPAAAEVAIIDPERNVGGYVEWARRRGLKITHVLETHIHADYASGARELATTTGASLGLSAYDTDELFEVVYDHREIRDGDSVQVGGVRIRALHTPGHTPEHLSFMVYELARSETVPEIIASGDFLFVGSLGRPDLLGEEAKLGLAKQLYSSVRERIAELPDGLEIAPAHGAGSMCGAGMSGRPTSTLGYERIANPYLSDDLSEDEFVEMILESAPPFPPYYRRMKELNSKGPGSVGDRPPPPALDPDEFERLIDAEGAVVIDLRAQLAFGGAHVPGSLGIGAGEGLATWAAWLVPYGRPILLVDDDDDRIEPAVRCLYRVGLDDVHGFLAGGIEAWSEAGKPLAELPQLSAGQVHDALDSNESLRVLDVRGDGEWREGHIENAFHVHGGHLAESSEGLPEGDGFLAVVCGTGYRSTAVASLLQARGYEGLINVTGGMSAWLAAGYPVVRS